MKVQIIILLGCLGLTLSQMPPVLVQPPDYNSCSLDKNVFQNADTTSIKENCQGESSCNICACAITDTLISVYVSYYGEDACAQENNTEFGKCVNGFLIDLISRGIINTNSFDNCTETDFSFCGQKSFTKWELNNCPYYDPTISPIYSIPPPPSPPIPPNPPTLSSDINGLSLMMIMFLTISALIFMF